MSNKPEYSIFDPAEIPCEEISDANELVKEPVVSVDMITYNHGPYIRQAIEGVLQQEVDFPYELVIGEDCSTDGTREIVFEYQKKYADIIRVITSEQNVGAHKNALRTEKACRGKYIAWCEGDDYWHHPRKLQKQFDYLEGHTECGLVFSDYNVYDVKSQKRIQNYMRWKRHHMPLSLDFYDLMRGPCPILTCTVVVRRGLLERVVDSDPILYQSDRFLLGDTQRWVEISYLSKLFCLEDSTAVHNLLSESVTRSKDVRKRLRFALSSKEVFLYLCDKYSLPTSIRKEREAKWCCSALQLAFYERDPELADMVKKKKEDRFTYTDWLKYFGSRNIIMHHVLKLMVYCRNRCLFRNVDSWFQPPRKD